MRRPPAPPFVPRAADAAPGDFVAGPAFGPRAALLNPVPAMSRLLAPVLALLVSHFLVAAAPAWAADPPAAGATKPKAGAEAPTKTPAKPVKPASPPAKPTPPAAAAPPRVPFSYDKVADLARALASHPYEPPVANLPRELAQASYDDHRKLRFRRGRGLWFGKSRFEVQFFHMGFLFKTPVKVNVVDGGVTAPFAFDKAMFDYGDTDLAKAITGPLDFAGFRVHYDLNGPDYKDELIVFLGASYFRVLGREQRYGLSARGLAVDIAEPRGEEFPFFREFWLVTPEAKGTELTLYALLDSQRVTGAYQFVISPGSETRVAVSARLFFRGEIAKLGIAPLTSMHLYAENRARQFDDHRPEVHDSDGVLIHSGSGAWLWRPLVNGRDLRVSAFGERNPKGFGLMQRDRVFSHYEDTEAEYHKRPSYWVEPVGDWGEGVVELVEIPSNEEIHDNVVAFWVPRERPQPGGELSFSYILHSMLGQPADHRLARVLDTRLGSSIVPGSGDRPSADRRLVVIEFEGGELPLLGAKLDVQPEIVSSAGVVTEPHVMKLPEGGRWRASFRLDLGGASSTELMVRLLLDGAPLTETWLYRYTP
jgi:glucans biosynthesis protein